MFRKDLEKENVTIHSSSEVVNYAKTSIATNTQEIVLFIKLPKLDPRIFRKIHVHPIFHHQQQIHSTKKFFLVHQTEKFVVKTIEPTIYHIEDIEAADSTCIPRLLDGKPAMCNYTSNPVQQEVVSLDMNHILVNTANNFTLLSDCTAIERILFGSYLIQFENCTIRINNVSYTSKPKNITGQPINLSLDGITITKNGDVLNLSMEHLHKLQAETRKDLDLLRLTNNSLHFPHWSLFGGITLLPIIIGFVILFSIFSHRITNIKLETIPSINDHHTIPEPRKNIENFKTFSLTDTMPLEVHH